MERHSAGYYHLHPRCCHKHISYDGCRFYHVLEVIEHQEQMFIPQIPLHSLKERLTSTLPYGQRLSDLRYYQSRVADGSQVDEKDSLVEFIQQSGSHLQGQAGLACARGTDQGEQAHFSSEHEVAQARQLGITPNKRGEVCGEVVWRISAR